MENNLNNLNQANTPVQNNIADDEIDLRELFTAIWQGKWIIIAITTLFAVASVFYAINQPNIYKSEVLLAPANQDKASGLSNQLGGLASLAGINLGGSNGVDKTQMALEILKSRKFITNFIDKHNLLPNLMASKSWNQIDNEIIYNLKLYNPAINEWSVNGNIKKPTLQEAYRVFRGLQTYNLDKETGMVTISIQHLSPIIAKKWVDWLVQDINLVMKERDVNEANKSIDFLSTQIEQTKVADIRTVLYRLIEEQVKIIMFAKVRDEYVFKTIDPAIVPEQRSKPSRSVISVLGTLFGMVVGVFVVFLVNVFRK